MAPGARRLTCISAKEVGRAGEDRVIHLPKDKASVLLDTMTGATKVFVQEKLGELSLERGRLEAALAAELRAYVGRTDEFRSCGRVEEQRTFLRGFTDRIEVKPREGEALLENTPGATRCTVEWSQDVSYGGSGGTLLSRKDISRHALMAYRRT